MTDLDEVLRSAMRSARRPTDARPSLSDVRRRARRRNRHRTAAMAGVLGVAGVAATALVVRRDEPGQSVGFLTDGTDVAPTTLVLMTTTSILGVEQPTTITASMVWNALAAIGIEPADEAAAAVMPTPEQLGCSGEICASMFAYVVWHEIARMAGTDAQTLAAINPDIDFSAAPVEGQVVHTGAYVGFPATSTTAIIGPDSVPPSTVVEGTSPANVDETTTTAAYFDGVMLIDAGAPAGAMDDAFARLEGYNRTIFPSSGKTSEQTMVMPISGDTAMATAVGAAIGVDGFDTWDPSFVGEGTSGIVAVIVGADYWAVNAPTTTTSVP